MSIHQIEMGHASLCIISLGRDIGADRLSWMRCTICMVATGDKNAVKAMSAGGVGSNADSQLAPILIVLY